MRLGGNGAWRISMYISKMTLVNFKNFYNSNFVFDKGVNTIVGENASGKTNLFRAMRILFDDSMSFRERILAEVDFCRGLDTWKGHWIVIKAEFRELDTSEYDRMLAYHTTDGVTGSTGSVTYLFRPSLEIRKKIFEEKNSEKRKTIILGMSIDNYEVVFVSRSTVDLSVEENYKKYIGDFKKMEFPDPNDAVFNEIEGTAFRGNTIIENVTCTYIQALRDAVREIKYSRYSPLKNILSSVEDKIEPTEREKITGNVLNLNTAISSIKEINNVESLLQNKIEKSVGNSYSPNLNIKSNISEDLTSLFRSLEVWVSDSNGGVAATLDDISLGGANIIYLSIKLLENNFKSDKVGFSNFLLIEEPEAHIHTHIQKTLFNNLNETRTQIFVSTHSTHISSVAKVSKLNVLSVGAKFSKVFYPSTGLDPKDILKTERYLDAIRTNLLFAKGIVLVEGDAEEILIPHIIKNCLGISLDEIGVCIVNLGSTGFDNVARLFSKERIQKNCSIVTDLDKAIVNFADPLPVEEKEMKFYNKQKRSQEKGEARKKNLDETYSGNEFVKIFLAENTFEVQLIEENRACFKSICKEIYSSDLEEMQKEIDSASKSVYGRRALRMADYRGKGWFAIDLAGEIDKTFIIPDYIINSISFASKEHIGLKTVVSMLKYIVTEDVFKAYKDLKDIVSISKKLEIDLPNSNLTKFIKALL